MNPGRLIALGGVLLAISSTGAATQEVATPLLTGSAFVGDTLMTGGTVVLHHLTDGAQGRLDSMNIGRDGTFRFSLPNVPGPEGSDVYFASVRHDGVLYFGPAVTAAVQLDSLYEVHAYDTLLAPAQGATLALQSRSIFFEPDSVGWRITDLFQIRNEELRTVVAREGGRVWSYPLPAEATNVSTGEGEIAADAAQYEGGELVVRAALSPGERIFVVRYHVPSPVLSIPTPQPAEAMDVLIREPAPALAVDGLEMLDRVELEAGSTYLRFTGEGVDQPSVEITESQERGPPPVEWAAVALAFILAITGLIVLRPTLRTVPAEGIPDRQGLLFEVARLDADFPASSATPTERRVYERRRADLIRRIRALD